MIEFPCFCGVKYELPEDQAGSMFQCKKCGRLITVPTLDDLNHIDVHGGYALDSDDQPQARREKVAELPGDSTIAVTPAPRYDPFTGERIRAINVDDGIVSAEARKAPRAPPQSKSNRQLAALPPRFAWLILLGEMLMAKNVTILLVMIIVYFLFAFGIFWVYIMGAFMFVFFPIIMLAFCMSYFSAVVQETGPGERDDLPPPLRYVEWRADIWDPLIHFTLSAGLCFCPAIVAVSEIDDPRTGYIVGGILGGLGMIFFPALFMTASVDGVVANFRPDRLLGVIGKAQLAYLPALIGWTAGLFALVNGTLLAANSFAALWNPFSRALPRPWIGNGWMKGFLFIAAGLYFCCYACWMLGLIWRKHHPAFPWVAQRFTREKDKENPVPAKQPVASPSADSHD